MIEFFHKKIISKSFLDKKNKKIESNQIVKEVKINGKERKENNSNGVTVVDMKGVHGPVRTIHP